MERPAQNDNGRVTLALLQRDVRETCEQVQAMRGELRALAEKLDGRVGFLERDHAALMERVEGQGRDVSALKGESRAWNIINTVGVAIAAIVAAVTRPQP